MSASHPLVSSMCFYHLSVSSHLHIDFLDETTHPLTHPPRLASQPEALVCILRRRITSAEPSHPPASQSPSRNKIRKGSLRSLAVTYGHLRSHTQMHAFSSMSGFSPLSGLPSRGGPGACRRESTIGVSLPGGSALRPPPRRALAQKFFGFFVWSVHVSG